MWNPFSRRKNKDQFVESQFRTRLVAETRVGEGGFDAGSVRARASFERIVAQPRDGVQSELVPQRSGVGRVVHSRRVRFAFVLVFVLVGVGGGVNVFLHQDGKKEDILTRAQAEYEDKQGIIYIRGSTKSYNSQTDIHGKRHIFKERNPIKLWGTSDGLYVRMVEKMPKLKSDPSRPRREYLFTPDGSCFTSSDLPGFVTYYSDSPKRGHTQAEGTSCPVGLGLRPRVHLGDSKARLYQASGRASQLPLSVRKAVLQTGKLLRQILAGKFQRHTVEEITERGRRVYRVKAWKPVTVYDKMNKKHLLKNDFTVETLILDKKTLRLLSYEERTDIAANKYLGERSLFVYSIVLDQLPRFYPETKANFYLLRTQFAPSRVDSNPLDKNDIAIGKRLVKLILDKRLKQEKQRKAQARRNK